MKRRHGPKEKASRAAATTREADLPLERKTQTKCLKGTPDANEFALRWVARRCRVERRWAHVIVQAAGLGGADE